MKTFAGTVVAALVLAVPAHADTTDDRFVDLVTHEIHLDLQPGEGASVIIAAGRGVCRMLNEGYSENDVYDRDMANQGGSIIAGPTQADTSMFIGLAEASYCPQYVEELR